jgi:hypothetical protein
VIEERQVNVIHATLKAAGRMCVFSGGTSNISTTMKKDVFCNFDFADKF